MATQVASLYGLLALDDRDFVRGMDAAEGKFDSLGGRMDKFGARISGLGVELSAMTQPLMDFGLQGIKTAATFESTMAEISARTGIVGDDLTAISDFALQMGADTAFSGQQAAEAFLQLLTSGQSAEQAFTTLPAVLDAAAASGEDLGHTADVVTDIMAAFGINAAYSGEVVDILARAAGASSADMSDLGAGFANVGGVARTFGMTVEDTAAVLAIFSENGIKGAEAGTQLKSMLLNLTRPTDDVQGVWKQLGVSFYDAAGNARPLQNVIADLDAALDKLPINEQNELMQTLGGSYGIVGLTALRGSISIDQMKTSMEGAAGASEVADARMSTFNGAMDSLGGSIESLQTRVFLPFLENVLSPIVIEVTKIINSVTDWAQANPELANTILLVLGGLTLLGPVLMAVGSIISGVGTVVGILGGAIGLLFSPIGIAIAAAVALGAAYLTNFGGIRDFIDQQVRPRLEQFFTFLGNVWEKVRPALENLFNWFVTTGLPAIRDFVVNQVLPKIQEFFNFLGNVWNVVSPALTDLFNWFVTTGMPAIRDFIVNKVQPAVEKFFGVIEGAWALISPVLSDIYDWFVTSGLPGIRDFIDSVGVRINEFINTVAGIWTNIQQPLNQLWTGITGALQPIIDLINSLKAGFDSLTGMAGAARTTQQAVAGSGLTQDQLWQRLLGAAGGNDALARISFAAAGGSSLPKRDMGGDGVAGQPYLIGVGAQPELFTPRSAGTFTPANQMPKGDTYQVVVYANDAAGGAAAGDAFTKKLKAEKRRMGY